MINGSYKELAGKPPYTDTPKGRKGRGQGGRKGGREGGREG